MKRLKPCPFCGGKAKILKYHSNGEDGYIVMCTECNSRSPMYLENAKEEVVTLWNNRVRGIMTRAEKFENDFGLKVDTDMDCGFFDCTDKECKNCQFYANNPTDRKISVSEWWNEEIVST